MENSNQSVAPDQLKSYLPFSKLDDPALILVASVADEIALKKGKVLFERGSDDEYCYLLKSGSLILEADDGKRTVVEEGTQPALWPIASLKPRKYKVIAASHSVLYLVKDEALALARKGLSASSVKKDELPEIEMTEVTWRQYGDLVDDVPEQGLSEKLLLAIREGTLPLPSLPDVALKVRELVDAGANNAEIARYITMDPVIAAKLISIANSVFYKRHNSCSDVPTAIARIGTQVVKQLVFSLALQSQFDSGNQTLDVLLNEAWQDSVEVGALCFALAEHLHGFEPEKALLAGLLHNIGAIPVMKFVEQLDKVPSDTAIQKLLMANQNQAGELLLKSWGFDELLCQISGVAGQWHRDHQGAADYVDLVLLCQFLYKVGIGGDPQAKGMPDLDSLPAYQKLVDEEEQIGICEKVQTEAKEQVEEVRSLLGKVQQ